jgi:rRNA-processing protein FCF1
MLLIVLDTDFLIKITNDPLPKFDRAILERSNLATLSYVIDELKGLLNNERRKTASRARRALDFLESNRQRIHIIPKQALHKGRTRRQQGNKECEGFVDRALLDFAKENPLTRIVATLDSSILSDCESLGLSYLTIRQGRAFLRLRKEQGQHI